MPESRENDSLVCESCGAVWFIPPAPEGSQETESPQSCLECGGKLVPRDGTRADQQESGS